MADEPRRATIDTLTDFLRDKPKFATLAKEWIEAQGDPDALCDFINQRLDSIKLC